MKIKLIITALMLMQANQSALAGNDILLIGDFSHAQTEQWKEKEFAGNTHYSIVELDGKSVLKANSLNSASAFYLEKKVNIKKWPYLNWSWKNSIKLLHKQEQDKIGDDFAGRVYVVKNGGLFFWNTLALTYVWANEEEINQSWDNPFAGSNAQMLVANNNNNSEINQWVDEKHNVFADMQRLYGETIEQIDGIAIMSDSDNSPSEQALMFYGDVFFTQQ